MNGRLAARLRSDAPHQAPARQACDLRLAAIGAVRAVPLALVSALIVGCSSGPAKPATLDTKNEACTQCRMMVSNKRFAAQIVAPREEPRFFDDIGCLRTYLSRNPGLPSGSIAYVADYRDGTWIPAARAHYLQNDTISTPMASGLIAFADRAARDASPEARAGRPQNAVDVFGAAGPPDGSR